VNECKPLGGGGSGDEGMPAVNDTVDGVTALAEALVGAAVSAVLLRRISAAADKEMLELAGESILADCMEAGAYTRSLLSSIERFVLLYGYGIGGARRVCVARVNGVFGGV